MHRDKSAKMAIWQKNSHFAILALLSLCIDFKNSFCQMTSLWVLWNTYYILLLKKCPWPCPGPSIYLFERINWIISSFPCGISNILLDLGSWDNFGSLGSRIRDGPFQCVSKVRNKRCVLEVLNFCYIKLATWFGFSRGLLKKN